MKKINHNLVFLFLAFSALLVGACNQTSSVKEASIIKSDAEFIKQGEHLVGIMGCNDCHTPKTMGPNGPELITDRLLSGYPADRPVLKFDNPMIKEGFAQFYPDLTAGIGPWGISFAGNLTPHETGIGTWSEEQFKKALTQGKYKGLEGSRTLFPPMPWQNYKNLTDEEIHSIFLYLKSLKPVSNLVPAHIALENM